ncbi:MAG: hypothetical protein KatS3mg084_0215 [Candidatus Dojkabacteria bacterium]|nr:MAG: hypothetical protein KatS3mg084_0215 [Candidatus Dojkabacteria bacterium]
MSDQQNNQQNMSQYNNDERQLSSTPNVNGYMSPYANQVPQYTVLDQSNPISSNNQFVQTQQQSPQSQQSGSPEPPTTNIQDLMSYINTPNRNVTNTTNVNNPYVQNLQNIDIPKNLEEVLQDSAYKPSLQTTSEALSENSALYRNEQPAIHDQNKQSYAQENSSHADAKIKHPESHLDQKPHSEILGLGPNFSPSLVNQNLNTVNTVSVEQTNSPFVGNDNNKTNPTADVMQNSEIPSVHNVVASEPLQTNQNVTNTVVSNSGNDTLVSNRTRDFNPEVDLVIKNQPQKHTDIKELLQLTLDKDASDLHIASNYPPFIRIDDKLVPVGEILEPNDVKNLVYQVLSTNHRELFEVNKEIDLSYQFENKARFRINAYYEKGNIAAAFRPIPTKIRSIKDLGLPAILLDIANAPQGLFLVTGPTGSGKSTTLAAMIQHINETSPKHVVTIEDPIEYVYPRGTAIINQRELGTDTHDWNIAMKSALRQDPDVILIGELRDFETIQLAITLAETGHLVFSTLHTYSTSQAVDRILDVFPPHQQQQIRTQLGGTLKGVLSQRLVPMIGGGRCAAIELLIVTSAVQTLIREGKTYQIDNVIETSAESGMVLLEKSLVKLVRQGKISAATAQNYAIRPERIIKMLKAQN